MEKWTVRLTLKDGWTFQVSGYRTKDSMFAEIEWKGGRNYPTLHDAANDAERVLQRLKDGESL